jgi:hypothetical protein
MGTYKSLKAKELRSKAFMNHGLASLAALAGLTAPSFGRAMSPFFLLLQEV